MVSSDKSYKTILWKYAWEKKEIENLLPPTFTFSHLHHLHFVYGSHGNQIVFMYCS